MGNEKRQHSFDFAVSRNRWTMWILGLWPTENDLFSELRFFLAFVLMVLQFIPTVVYCFVTKSILKNLDAFVLIISIATSIIKLTLTRMHKKNLKLIVEELSDDWNTISKLSIESQKLMISYAKRGRLLILNLIIFLYFSAIVFLLTPIFLSWKRNSADEVFQSLPMKSFYPGDFQNSPTYEFLYVLQCISGMAIATAIASSDCFLVAILFHLCGQLEIVSRNIENLNAEETENLIDVKKCNKCLKCIIERHIKLIRNAEVIQESFSIIMLAQVTGNVLILSIQGYTIIKVSSARNFFGILSYIIYMIFSTFIDFVYCYIGEYLIQTSTSVGRKVYDLNWYNIKPESVRSMLLIILRSQKPLELSARHFFSMSLATYKNIIMSAFSYASFLLAINKNRF